MWRKPKTGTMPTKTEPNELMWMNPLDHIRADVTLSLWGEFCSHRVTHTACSNLPDSAGKRKPCSDFMFYMI